MDVLEEVEGKAIIWANYIHDIETIVKAIQKKYGPDSVVQYYGAIESETRQKNIELFQDPESPVRFFIDKIIECCIDPLISDNDFSPARHLIRGWKQLS